MEEALISRLRASAGIIAAAGVFNGRPAIDLHERKSNDKAAFPAIVVTVISPGRSYDQDGPDSLQRRVVRFECFGLSAGSSILLKRALTTELEQPALVEGVRFSRGRLRFERSFSPEDVATLRIFRTIADFEIPSNS